MREREKERKREREKERKNWTDTQPHPPAPTNIVKDRGREKAHTGKCETNRKTDRHKNKIDDWFETHQNCNVLVCINFEIGKNAALKDFRFWWQF